MSITIDTAKNHGKDPAVSCCRFEAGTIIKPSNLEDPNIFEDLEESNLLKIPKDCLNIEEVLGAKLIKTIEALTPITKEYIKKTQVKKEETTLNLSNQSIKINIEIPLSIANQMDMYQTQETKEITKNDTPKIEENILLRNLIKKHFKIDEVKFSKETKIDKNTLYLKEENILCQEAVNSQALVKNLKIDIITPDRYKEYSETIMDVQPIATKEEGELGSGITRVIDGVVMMVTGTDENGVQIGEFGSSEGALEENIMWNRPGAPDRGEIIIKTQVTIKAGSNMERPGPQAAHLATDYITNEIREALKKADEALVVNSEEMIQYRRLGKKRVVIVKEIMGQGAMHDNLILPIEPVGTLGAKPNVDLGNIPVVLSPLEVLDGGIHALTCIGPASKENSRHYYREPLVIEAMKDEEIDLVGVIFIGSPQVNSEKFYVSKRLGMMIEAMGVEGAIVTTEGFGNNHIDFASHIEEIGSRNIAVVGVTFSAVQGALVVGNKYMKHMIDNNKSKDGIENEILSNNTLCKEDAIRALYMLKAVMSGEEIKPAQRKYNNKIKMNNIDLIEEYYTFQ